MTGIGFTQAIEIGFEGLQHGTIVNNQFAAQGVTISAINTGGGPNLAVAFDTNRDNTRDDDLENPFTGGNLPSNTDMGFALILQENNYGTGDGVANKPDDEGSRPAGWLHFTFDSIVNDFGFDVIDVENLTAEPSFLRFQRNGSQIGSDVSFGTLAGLNNATWGNNSLNRIDPYSVDGGFDKVSIRLGGSMAFDNINWSVPDGGSTVALLGVGLIGLGAIRRRK